MEKSPEAFRTISEVADWLGVPTHVLRFWESRFKQIKPVKRAGGRRYYRPSDMALIGGIKVLLHDEGMTIRGVQKLLREKGTKHVSASAPGLTDSEGHTVIDGETAPKNVTPNATDSTEIRENISDPPEVMDAEIVAEGPTPAMPSVGKAADQASPATDEDTVAADLFDGLVIDGPAEATVEAKSLLPEAASVAMPDIPEQSAKDPDDDDGAHGDDNGISYKLRTGNLEKLMARSDELGALRDRLAHVVERSMET